jgi:hypothetical protein
MSGFGVTYLGLPILAAFTSRAIRNDTLLFRVLFGTQLVAMRPQTVATEQLVVWCRRKVSNICVGLRIALFCRMLKSVLSLTLLGTTPLPAWSQQNSTDLTDRSLDDLMNIQVTSVSKTEQKMSQVATAIFVITQEDIQRSGATNIPDLLRMVPGLDVAQINGKTWAITARGLIFSLPINCWC